MAFNNRRQGKAADVASALALIRRTRTKFVWEQLPGIESDADYAKFQTYLQLGPKRSLHQVSVALGLKVGAEAASGTVYRLSQTYAWVERAHEFDEWSKRQQEQADRQQADRLDTNLNKWTDRQKWLSEQMFEVGRMMLEVVQTRMLRAEGIALLPDGTQAKCTPEPLDLKDKELPSFARAGTALIVQGIDLFRSGYDLETGEYGEPALSGDLHEVTDEELLKYAELVRLRELKSHPDAQAATANITPEPLARTDLTETEDDFDSEDESDGGLIEEEE